MKNVNHQFLESYIRIEKFCNEIYNEKNGVTCYIEEMKLKNVSVAQDYYWEDDLDRLKKYRHIRNKMVHEVDGFDYENCSKEDIGWLGDFYNKLMTGDDPLSRYRNNSLQRLQGKKTSNAYVKIADSNAYYTRDSRKTAGIYIAIAVIVVSAFVAAGVLIMGYFLSW